MSVSHPTILLADDDHSLLEALTRRCRHLGLNVITADSATGALSAVADQVPDVVCMDVDLPGGNGLAATEMLLSDERFQSIPVIVVTGKNDEGVERRCHTLPAYYIPKSPHTWDRLEPLLRELLDLPLSSIQRGCGASGLANSPQISEPTAPVPPPAVKAEPDRTPRTDDEVLDAVFAMMDRTDNLLADLVPNPHPGVLCIDASPWVLCIDDDQDFSAALTHRLESNGIGVINAFDGSNGVTKAFTEPANAILLDFNMPNGQGDYVLRRLKENPATRDIPVIVLTGNRSDSVRHTMLTLGADAFFTKPPDFDALLKELSRFIEVPVGATTG